MNDIIERPMAQAIFSLRPRSLPEAIEFAKIIADSDLVPKDYRGKWGNVLVAVQMGTEIGLAPMQAVQNIAVINGRPSVWGDALWALVKAHPLCEWTREVYDELNVTATCTVKRRGSEAVVRSFSIADAEKARLWNKEGPWQQYPRRMLQMRARAFACRDAMPDALKGLHLAEEQGDIERDMGDAERIDMATGEITHAGPAAAELSPSQAGFATLSAPAPAEHSAEPPQAPAPAGRITENALKRLRQMLGDRELTEAFCQRYQIADPSELPMSKTNEALSWVEQQTKG